jgi:hypothetical protein
MPDPLAAIALVGAMGRVYTIAEMVEQPAAQPRLIGARPPIHEEGESLFIEVLRPKSGAIVTSASRPIRENTDRKPTSFISEETSS